MQLPLDLENCRLLGSEQSGVLDLYNTIYNIANCEDDSLRRHFRTNAEFRTSDRTSDGTVQSLDDVLSRVRSTLQRECYRIGFVGPFQVGKTSAVNRVLTVKLLAEGGDGACTSIATVVQLQESPSALPEFSVRYFTKEQLQQRFAFAGVSRKGDEQCPINNLPEPGSVELHELKKWADVAKSEKSKFLELLVAQYHGAEKGLLGSLSEPVRCVDTFDLERRLDRLVRYRVGEAASGDVKLPLLGSPASTSVIAPGLVEGVSSGDVELPLLVREVVVRIHVPNVPSELELIDLPGLGTTHAYDTELTKSYVRELDGLLLFSESGKPESESMPELLEELKRSRSSLTGRVFRIITKIDQSGKDNLYRSRYFTKLSANNAELGIDDPQVRFLCQRATYLGNLIPIDGVPADVLKDILCVETKNGEVVLPSSEQAFGLFEQAFRRYTEDGGSGALQKLIRDEIRETVRDAVCKEARAELKKVAGKLSHCINLALQGGVNDAGREVARALSSELLKCTDFLRPGGINLSDTAAKGFFEQCWNSLRKHVTTELVQAAQQRDRGNPVQSRWVQLHEYFAKEIHVACRRWLPQVAEDIFKKLISRLQSFVLESEDLKKLMKEEKVDEVSALFPKKIDPLQKLWDASLKAKQSLSELAVTEGHDALSTATLKDLAQLSSLEMIRDKRTQNLFLEHTPDMYVTVMRCKVEAFAYQQVARLRLVVRAASMELEDEMNDMANSKEDLAGNLTTAQRSFLEASRQQLTV